jgi:hypothetical protein
LDPLTSAATVGWLRQSRAEQYQQALETQRVQDAEEYSILKIRLETDIQNLEQHLEAMRATYQVRQRRDVRRSHGEVVSACGRGEATESLAALTLKRECSSHVRRLVPKTDLVDSPTSLCPITLLQLLGLRRRRYTAP